VGLNLESFDFDRAVYRIRRLIWLLALAGALVFLILRGASWGASFLAGAAISAVSFDVLHRMVASIDPASGGSPKTWKMVLAGARWLIIAGVVYVMMKSFGLNILAVVCGLLAAAAAVVLEILYEFIHGT